MKIKKICILSNGTLKKEYNIPNVIRCKDCKYYCPTDIPFEERDYGFCRLIGIDFEEDDFCSRGVKKDD